MSFRSAMIGAAAGAAAAYLLDPQSGVRRRNVGRDRAMAFFRRRGREASQTARYAEGVVQGMTYRASPDADRSVELNDPALARKVESEIFRPADAPKGDVAVSVENGVVQLRGQVKTPEQKEQLGRAAGEVDGVERVENLLHTPGEPPHAKSEQHEAAGR
jgi:gas vesicle protein